MKKLAVLAAGASSLLASTAAMAQTAPDTSGAISTAMTESFGQVSAVQTAATPLVLGIVAVGIAVSAAIGWMRKGRG